MKKLFLVLALSTATVQAADLGETWKKINSYRVVSGIKAAAFLGATAIIGHHIWTVHGPNLRTSQTVPAAMHEGALTAGLTFAALCFMFDYFYPNAKHALAIKD
jgi:hypothetical protein